MRVKFVYSVVSNEADYYMERAIISAYSLKRHNPDAEVVLVTDTGTYETLSGTRALMKGLANEIIPVSLSDELSQIQKSRFLKTSVRQLVRGDFLFIDVDTVILDELSELDAFECDMALCLQWDCLEEKQEMSIRQLKKFNRACGIAEDEMHGIVKFYNSGVMFCRDTEKTHGLFEKWHSLWYESSTTHGWHYDQADLWRADVQSGYLISELPGIYNCMALGFEFAMRNLSECRIFHYFSNSKKLDYLPVKRRDFLDRFKQNGFSEELDAAIDNAKIDYISGLAILEKTSFAELEDYKKLLISSPSFILTKKIVRRLPFVDKFLGALFEFFVSARSVFSRSR